MRWGYRDLVRCPVYFGLCLDEKKYYKEMARLKVDAPPSFLARPTAGATTHLFTNKANGKRCAIVCLGDCSNYDGIQIAALIVHEAVHIWQDICELMGEDTPSPEFEAYSVQALSQELMNLYVEMNK